MTRARARCGGAWRLGGVLRFHPLVFAAAMFRRAIVAGHTPVDADWWWPNEAIEGAIAERARATFLR